MSQGLRFQARVALAICGAAALATAVWALLPAPDLGEPPWRDEISLSDYLSLADLANRVSEEELRYWLPIIDPYGELAAFVELSHDCLSVRAHKGGQPVVEISLRTSSPPRPAGGGGNALVGARILLDPGHFGGSWSEEESRHFTLEGGPPVREGDLTYATARLLEDKLRAAGATVRLTRNAPPLGPLIPEAFFDFDVKQEERLALGDQIGVHPYSLWQRLYPSRLSVLLLARAEKRRLEADPFYLFKRYDLRRRAALAAAWGAHLTLSLHFNMTRNPNVNGVTVFVPGNFLPEELDSVNERYYAIRRLLEHRMPQTVALASAMSRQMQDHMGLPALGQWPRKKQLPIKLPVDADNGVFARNLAMLRRPTGIALLAEGPMMNQPEEYKRLTASDIWVDGYQAPHRVEEYSEALYQSILHHATLLLREDVRRPRSATPASPPQGSGFGVSPNSRETKSRLARRPRQGHRF